MFQKKYSENSQYFGIETITGLEEIVGSISLADCCAIDIGCGQGRDALYLAKQGIDVTALDIEAIAITQLQRLAEQDSLPVKTICQNIITTELPIDFYDIGVARTLFDHLEKNDVPIAIEKLTNTIRPGGHVFITVFTEDDPGFQGETDITSECSAAIKHYFAKGELLKYFADWNIIFHDEYMKDDLSHGPPHKHGVAKLIAQKRTTNS